MRVDALVQQAATQAVSRAAQATGVDFSLLLATARRESGLDRTARAASSSAAGLFQFVDSTWMDLVKKYGARHGVQGDPADPAQRRAILDLRYDPDLAARMAGELTRENEAALQGRLGRAPSRGEVYAAHVLGADGAARLIEAAQVGGESAAALLPRAAAANRAIFFDKDGGARTPAAVLAKLDITVADGADAAASVAPTRVVTDLPAASAGRAAGAAAALVMLSGPSNWANQVGSDLWTLALRAYGGGKE